MTEQFFSPESVLWRVDREMALLLGGGRALLMQIAHPKVAAGVAAHSGFRQDPLLRLRRTMTAMWSIVFDDATQARRSLERVKKVHQGIRGEFTNPNLQTALTYSALDPELLLWVHATLVDSALIAYEQFVMPLSARERAQYYEDTRKLALLFEVPAALIPQTLSEFACYMERMLSTGEISVTANAQALAGDILRPRLWLLRPARPLLELLTAGLLPPAIRRSYDLPWSRRRQQWFHAVSSCIRNLRPYFPAAVRVAPHARAAERRLQASAPHWR